MKEKWKEKAIIAFCKHCKAMDIGKDIKCNINGKYCPMASVFIKELDKQ